MPYADRTTQLQYWRDRYKSKASEISAKNKARYQRNSEEIKQANRVRSRANRERYLAARRRRYVANRAQILARCKEYRQRNKTQVAAKNKRWAEANRTKANQIKRAWRLRNVSASIAQLAKRRAAKRRAVPKWANSRQTAAVYRRAAEITRQTGIRHHVDHIYPVLSPRVCGLHVHYNLRVIPMTENLKKSNKFPTASEFLL